jgi:hypothetical protein
MFLAGSTGCAIQGTHIDEGTASVTVARDEEGGFCRKKGG